MKVLEYYSIPDAEQHPITGEDVHEIDYLYIIRTEPPENIPERAVDLLSWYAAYDVCIALQNIEGAKLIGQKIQEIQLSEGL